jgi:hypothetical protein
MLELLREQQGESQISQQEDRQNQCNGGDQVNLHGLLPQLLARLDVEKRQAEKDYRKNQHRQVLHRVFTAPKRPSPQPFSLRGTH